MSASAIDALFAAEPFPRSRGGRFVAALRDCARLQARRFPALARLYAREGFSPAALRSEGAVERLPFLHVAVFKEHDFRPRPPFRPALSLTSSGTGGQRSRIVLDEGSLRRVRLSARKVYAALGMVAEGRPANYLCMTYDPRQAKDLGTAFTDELLTSFTAKAEVHYAIRRPSGGEFRFDLDAALAALGRMSRSGLPLRVLGFPAHVLFTMRAWRERGLPPLRLGPESWVLSGGGWKGHAGDAIPKVEFYAEVSSWLGIPRANIRDLYGLVEHGIPYVECRLGRMHVPDYARVIVRDPWTLKSLPHGRKGLLQLVTPYLTSYPSFSVLASDWGLTRPLCRCGTPGRTLELLGRAGTAPAKGCAVTAAELLRAA
ncbi:MAG: acyl-protein synthetase [Elusimicrobia bacterium]|nr:acyl-protein synthetase [Elusimicrobiota bacterium]